MNKVYHGKVNPKCFNAGYFAYLQNSEIHRQVKVMKTCRTKPSQFAFLFIGFQCSHMLLQAITIIQAKILTI